MKSFIFLLISVCFTVTAFALETSDVVVSIDLEGEMGALEHEVAVSPGPHSSVLIDVVLRNDSNQDVSLAGATVSVPWLEAASDALLLASGASDMAKQPMRIVELGKGEEVPQSSMYLLAKDKEAVALAGMLSWNTFSTYLNYEDGVLTAEALGEGRTIRAGETVSLERIYLASGGHWQDALYLFADAIAAELEIQLPEKKDFIGWSTWDYYGRDWKMPEVVENARIAKELVPETNLVQIDGGWWPERGDYLGVRDNLKPNGMKRLSRQIRKLGLTSGIHFDGTRGDLQSEIARKHPEYFLKDEDGEFINHTYPNDGGILENIYFDYSHPGTQKYMRKVVRNIRRDWKFDYLKIDFLMRGLNEDIRFRIFKGDESREIVAYDRGMTSLERLRTALGIFREAMGDDAYFLACSAPFGPVLGFADGLRVGPDIFPNVKQYAINCFATASNFYLNGKVAYNDTDYVVVRSAEDEDERLVRNPKKSGGDLALTEAEMWANYVGLFGGPVLSSDNLTILRDERKALFQQSARLPKCDRFVPLDFWKHGRSRSDAFHVFLGEAQGRSHLAFFNWSDEEQTYRCVLPGNLGKVQLEALTTVDGIESRSGKDTIEIKLPAMGSVVFAFSEGVAFDQIRREVAVTY